MRKRNTGLGLLGAQLASNASLPVTFAAMIDDTSQQHDRCGLQHTPMTNRNMFNVGG